MPADAMRGWLPVVQPVKMSERALMLGTAGGAVLLSVIAVMLATCCGTSGAWGTDVLGVPGAVALARFRVIQPYETIGAIVLSIAAFWLAYRPRRRVADGARQYRQVERSIAWITIILTLVLLAIANDHRFSGEVATDAAAIE